MPYNFSTDVPANRFHVFFCTHFTMYLYKGVTSPADRVCSSCSHWQSHFCTSGHEIKLCAMRYFHKIVIVLMTHTCIYLRQIFLNLIVILQTRGDMEQFVLSLFRVVTQYDSAVRVGQTGKKEAGFFFPNSAPN